MAGKIRMFFHKIGVHSYNDEWNSAYIKPGKTRTCKICGKQQACRTMGATDKKIWWWDDLTIK